MPDDPEKTLQELRQRIATEGLPKLSAEALRSYKRQERHSPKLVPPTAAKPPLSLSQEALRLFHEKGDPKWPWQHRRQTVLLARRPRCAAGAGAWPDVF